MTHGCHMPDSRQETPASILACRSPAAEGLRDGQLGNGPRDTRTRHVPCDSALLRFDPNMSVLDSLMRTAR